MLQADLSLLSSSNQGRGILISGGGSQSTTSSLLSSSPSPSATSLLSSSPHLMGSIHHLVSDNLSNTTPSSINNNIITSNMTANINGNNNSNLMPGTANNIGASFYYGSNSLLLNNVNSNNNNNINITNITTPLNGNNALMEYQQLLFERQSLSPFQPIIPLTIKLLDERIQYYQNNSSNSVSTTSTQSQQQQIQSNTSPNLNNAQPPPNTKKKLNSLVVHQPPILYSQQAGSSANNTPTLLNATTNTNNNNTISSGNNNNMNGSTASLLSELVASSSNSSSTQSISNNNNSNGGSSGNVSASSLIDDESPFNLSASSNAAFSLFKSPSNAGGNSTIGANLQILKGNSQQQQQNSTNMPPPQVVDMMARGQTSSPAMNIPNVGGSSNSQQTSNLTIGNNNNSSTTTSTNNASSSAPNSGKASVVVVATNNSNGSTSTAPGAKKLQDGTTSKIISALDVANNTTTPNSTTTPSPTGSSQSTASDSNDEFTFLRYENVDIKQKIVNSYTVLLFIPQAEFPEYNFIGRILGPKGSYLDQIRKNSNCFIRIRGRGLNLNNGSPIPQMPLVQSNPTNDSDVYASYPLHVFIEGKGQATNKRKNLQKGIQLMLPLLVPTEYEKDILKRWQLQQWRNEKNSNGDKMVSPPLPLPNSFNSSNADLIYSSSPTNIGGQPGGYKDSGSYSSLSYDDDEGDFDNELSEDKLSPNSTNYLNSRYHPYRSNI